MWRKWHQKGMRFRAGQEFCWGKQSEANGYNEICKTSVEYNFVENCKSSAICPSFPFMYHFTTKKLWRSLPSQSFDWNTTPIATVWQKTKNVDRKKKWMWTVTVELKVLSLGYEICHNSRVVTHGRVCLRNTGKRVFWLFWQILLYEFVLMCRCHCPAKPCGQCHLPNSQCHLPVSQSRINCVTWWDCCP